MHSQAKRNLIICLMQMSSGTYFSAAQKGQRGSASGYKTDNSSFRDFAASSF